VALGRVFSGYFGFPCQSSFHRLLHNHHHLSSGAGTIGQQWPTYQVDSVSPHPEKLKKKTRPKYSPRHPALKVDSRLGQNFLFSTESRPILGPTQPSIKWIPVAFSGVKRQGREADHSPPSSAEVKKSGAILSLPPYVFMA
jgi:hypothetical protein